MGRCCQVDAGMLRLAWHMALSSLVLVILLFLVLEQTQLLQVWLPAARCIFDLSALFSKLPISNDAPGHHVTAHRLHL